MKKKPIQSFDILSRKLDRRTFLTRTGSAGLGMTGMASTLAQLQLMGEAAAAGSGMDKSQYKALVCFFLAGGCDTNNLLIPIGSHPDRQNYENDRRFVAVSEADIANAGTELNAPSAVNQQYGMHPSCTSMASLFNQGKLAMIANCGTLAVPIPVNVSLEEYNALVKPIQLFSHSDQVNQWFSSIPQNPFISGWAGRVANLFQTTPYSSQGINQHGLTSMLMTAAGSTDLLVSPGGTVPQYAVNRTGPKSFSGYGTAYSSALTNGDYRTNSTGWRLESLEATMEYRHSHILEQGYNGVLRSARANEETVGAAITEADSIVDLDAVFLGTYNGLIGTTYTDPTQLPNDVEEMLIICKLIAGRECLGNTRQIFFMNKGGFDNHADINNLLPPLLSDVDATIACFNAAMEALAAADPTFDYNMATLFGGSDFNRTWTPNTSGTDHAWGTHTFVCGGAVAAANPSGGKIYGTFPKLEVEGPNDVPGNNVRGRWIPQTSTDQYYARLSQWFGVAGADMEQIFPNLANGFTSPFDPAANLDFI